MTNDAPAHGLRDSGDRTVFHGGATRDRAPGKGRYDLLSPFALRELAVHAEQGAQKYEERNWEKGYSVNVCVDSAMRHLVDFLAGDDSENHLAAVMWNAMAAIHIRHMVNDGRLPSSLAEGFVPHHIQNPITGRLTPADEYEDFPAVPKDFDFNEVAVHDYEFPEPDESGLVTYARTELQRAGLFDEDSDYGGMIGEAVMEIVRTFSKQGHSGFSATMTTDIAQKLLSYEPLTPLTDDPAEWNEVSGGGLWQSRRNPAAFSRDGGATYKINGEAHVSAEAAKK